MDIIYDIETFPNCFIFCARSENGELFWCYEISSRRNQSAALTQTIMQFREAGHRMVGFNNVGFDYPVLHYILMSSKVTPDMIYSRAMQIINSDDRFGNQVRPSDCWVKQVDLYKIHHFDNKARMTSLKALEFNMRLPNISDLPFPVGTTLSEQGMNVLGSYCMDDVNATLTFYNESKEQLAFRDQLNSRYPGRDFTNYNDVKIGKEFFQMRLEEKGVPCYSYGEFGREPRQTPRQSIRLAECVPAFVQFSNPEFERIRQHFLRTTITETKGAFKDLVATVNRLPFVFGTGGIHASVENESFHADDEWMIYDVDVTSLYPSLAIEHGIYPAHLGPEFVTVYRTLREERLKYKKGTTENAAFKLALNGVYGASNDKFSCFYDPLYTMKITVGGQLMIAMLAEQLMEVEGLRIIQANTDGITMYLPRTAKFLVDAVCSRWEALTRLSLESVEYDLVATADVNSYIARKPDGTVKRKGRYEYDVLWHQDGSSLVIPKVAEKVILEGASIRDTLRNWPDKMDFMLRAKANKGTVLVLDDGEGDVPLDRTQRYYISTTGSPMFKIMPPLKGKTEHRRIAVQSGYLVTPCNKISDATHPINFEWYAGEVEKLCLGVL